jgi:hypothetical protein
MLRCQINRLNKTDVKEPYRCSLNLVLVLVFLRLNEKILEIMIFLNYVIPERFSLLSYFSLLNYRRFRALNAAQVTVVC